jgi:hypothetical protein
VDTFPIGNDQIADRSAVPTVILQTVRIGSRQSSLALNSFLFKRHRWIWRHGAEMLYVKRKYAAKAMIFAAIAAGYKSPLVILESRTVDAETYVEELISGSGIVPDVHSQGPHNYTFMYDGTSSNEINLPKIDKPSTPDHNSWMSYLICVPKSGPATECAKYANSSA